MIQKQAIQAYLTAPRDNFAWVKKLTPEQVDKEIAKLDYSLVIPLMDHQRRVFLLGTIYPNLCMFLSMGVGKTAIVLELLNFFRQKNLLTRKTLICVPTDEVAQSWETEIQKWAPNLPYTVLSGSSSEKWEQYSVADGLVIGTTIGLCHLVSTLRPAKKKQKNELVIDPKKMSLLIEDIEALIMDESTKVGNSQSLSFKVINQVSKVSTFRYALAGRPFGRDPIQLWAQFFLVDRGDTLSPFIGFYREVFFRKKKLIWHPSAIEYVFNPKRKDDLTRIIGYRSITYSLEECVSLPELARLQKFVTFPGDTLIYYNNLIQDMISAKGDVTLVKNVFLRMRQLSSGFLGIKDDETGDKSEIDFDTNPKMELLLELIDETPTDSKCIVFYDFTHSGRRIMGELKKRKIKSGWLWSGTKNWKEMERRFREDTDYKVLVIQNKKGNFGLNLQQANYCFFYESPVSGIDRDQAEKRIHRTGQKKTCFIIDLIMKGSMDERILQYQEEGKSLFQDLVSNPAKVLTNGSQGIVRRVA